MQKKFTLIGKLNWILVCICNNIFVIWNLLQLKELDFYNRKLGLRQKLDCLLKELAQSEIKHSKHMFLSNSDLRSL